MGFKGSNKSKSYNSTKEYRDLAQKSMDSWRPEAMQMIDQSTSDTMASLTGSFNQAGDVQAAKMQAGMSASGLDPMSMMAGQGDFQSQMISQLMQAQAGVDQNALAAKLGVGEQNVANQLQLAQLSGGSKTVQKEGWGAPLLGGLGAVLGGPMGAMVGGGLQKLFAGGSPIKSTSGPLTHKG